MITLDFRRRYTFLRENSGYVVGRRASGAFQLAKAEELLESAVEAELVRVRWEWDECPDLSWLEEGQTVEEVLGCVLEVRCPTCGQWDHVASLWGICDPDRTYLRVIEAELALESLSVLEAVA